MTDLQNLLFSDECLFVIDRGGQILKFLPGVAISLKHQEIDLLPWPFLDIIAETDKNTMSAALEQLWSSQTPQELEVLACDKSGKCQLFRWKLSLVDSAAHLRGREILTEKLERSLIHEVNNPLTIIQTRSFQLQQLAEANNFPPEKIKQFADSIYAAAARIAALLKSGRKA